MRCTIYIAQLYWGTYSISGTNLYMNLQSKSDPPHQKGVGSCDFGYWVFVYHAEDRAWIELKDYA